MVYVLLMALFIVHKLAGVTKRLSVLMKHTHGILFSVYWNREVFSFCRWSSILKKTTFDFHLLREVCLAMGLNSISGLNILRKKTKDRKAVGQRQKSHGAWVS